MAPIKTFVFLDYGTVRGTDATEVGLLAANRALILDPDLEEPTDKLIKDFRHEDASVEDYKEIVEFISRQEKPVCLVAHNGNDFDFIILKQELQNFDLSLPVDVLCADSLYVFYDILEQRHDSNMMYTGKADRDIFYEFANKPTVSYKLGKIYERVVRTPPVTPHPVENDITMKFRISRRLGERFLAWTDQIQRNFAEVEIKEINFMCW